MVNFLIAAAALRTPARNGYNVTETSPVYLRLPSGSLRIPQTGARDSARLDACSSHQRVCVPLDAAVTPCNVERLLLPVTYNAQGVNLKCNLNFRTCSV